MEATWNDYTETSGNPVDPATLTLLTGYGIELLLKPHAGYTEFSKYYRQWYKTGKAEVITTDGIMYFYRTHAKALAATNDTSITVFNPGAPNDTVPDNLFVATILKAPGTLKVTTGGAVSSKAVAAGVQFNRFAFNAGQQTFEVIRNGRTVVLTHGEPIVSSIQKYNFIPTSGFAYAR